MKCVSGYNDITYIHMFFEEGLYIQSFLYIELNVFSLVILLLIYFNIHKRNDRMLTEQRLFMLFLYVQSAILILDSLMWLLDGKTGPMIREIFIAVTVLYYLFNPLICMVWYFYVDYQIYRDEKHFKKIWPITIPAFANVIMTIVSIWSHTSFYLDENNVYHRGPLFLVMALIAFFYLFYTWVLTIVKRRNIPKQDFLPIAIFMLPVIFGGIVQTFFYGVSLIWVCSTISILIIFINIQNAQLYKDHLTGLFNRRQLDRYLHDRVKDIENGLLAGLMIDIDYFKRINDMYGHSAGDQALIDTSEILKKTFRKNDFIARFGGDEFVVVIAVSDKADLQKAIDRLHENVAQFNEQKTVPYTISLSIGYDCYFDQTDKTAKDFIRYIDDLMYQDKQLKINNDQ